MRFFEKDLYRLEKISGRGFHYIGIDRLFFIRVTVPE